MLRGRFATSDPTQADPVKTTSSTDDFNTRTIDEEKIGYNLKVDDEAGIGGDGDNGFDHGHSHLQELEVDIAEAIKDPNVEDFELDHSPYPEV